MKKVAIFGSSGHASEIADICDALGCTDICFVLQPSQAIGCHEKNCVFEAEVEHLHQNGYSFAIGISDGKIRERIFLRYPHFSYPNLIHPDSSFGRNQLQKLDACKGVIVAAGARFMSSIEIGNFSIFGLNSTIGHDCIISSYVSVMPGVNVSGNVKIDEFVFIGSGAVILPGNSEKKLLLSSGILVGAGAVVTKSFYEASVIKGIPAKPVHS